MRRLLLTLGLLAAPLVEATSQMPASLQPGQTVRITMRAGPRYVASLDSLRQDTLIVRSLRPPGSPFLHFGLPAIAILEVERGHGSRTRSASRRAVLGLAGGAALGALMAIVWYTQAPVCERRGECPSAGDGALVGGTAGFAIGLVSGLAGPSQVWESVPLSEGVALAVNRIPGGRVGVALKLR